MEVYVDNMLVKSVQAEDNLTHLAKMFNIFRMYKMKLNSNKCAFEVSLGKFMEFVINQRGIKANSDKIKVVLDMEVPRAMKDVQRLTGRIAALN